MQLTDDDLIRLRHMLDACLTAIRIANASSRAALENDETVVLALSRTIEIIGEAAGRISKSTRETNSQIPWAAIIAMRNRLIHAYFDVDLDQVWNAVTEDIPPLVAEIEKIIPPEANH